MSKLGSYSYPDRKITPILESVRLIGDKLKGNSASIDIIASTLGYKSANNGAFQHTLNDLRKYGLIEGRGKELKLTELAHKILVPHKGEDAMKEMIFHVPLWREIHEKFGNTPSDFSIALQKITGINRLEADAVKETISNLYIDAVSKISNETSNEIGDNANSQLGFQQSDTNVKFDSSKETLTFVAEGISIRITNDQDHLNKAGAFINLFLSQTAEKQGKKEKEAKS